MSRLRHLLAALLLVTGFNAQSPCDWFDHDGDGLIGGNTMLYALGNYGVVGGPMDPDSSGVQDLSGFRKKGTEHLSSPPSGH